MDVSALEYSNLAKLLSSYANKGRRESATFLNWFLENIYRLDAVSADDAICDETNDKGIDGIYVDHNAEEVHFLQSKISQKASTIGDVSIKQLIGSIHQFDTAKDIEKVLTGNANSELKKIISRNNLPKLVEQGYSLKAIYVANTERDDNTKEVQEHFDELIVYAASDIVSNFIEFDADEGIEGHFSFDTSYSGLIELSIDDGAKVYLLPVSATDLMNLKGISDGKLFSQNVRYSLGNTPVNKAIAKSVADTREHKNFSLYHNGITLICKTAVFDSEKESLRVDNYVVVNGAQSITTFFHNTNKLTEDLRVFLKVIALESDELSRKITVNTNNQNSIKARDLRSNHDLMLRLRAEFEDSECGYEFEIKRGQPRLSGLPIISNEDAGRNLLAFDLNEPYSCHQIYRIFDDKYADIFGRKEVTFGRLIFMKRLEEIVLTSLEEVTNRPFARYALTKYFFINVVSHIIRLFSEGRQLLSDIRALNEPDERETALALCKDIITGLVVDLNYELAVVDKSFDYKKEFKSPEAVNEWRLKLLRTYEKDFRREKAPGFGTELNRDVDGSFPNR